MLQYSILIILFLSAARPAGARGGEMELLWDDSFRAVLCSPPPSLRGRSSGSNDNSNSNNSSNCNSNSNSNNNNNNDNNIDT